MDIRKKFNIAEIEQTYYNLGTGLAIEYDASDEEKLDFMQYVIKELIDDLDIYGLIKFIDKRKLLDKIYNEENFKQVRERAFDKHGFLTPTEVEWIFYENESEKGVLYLNIYFETRIGRIEHSKNLWLKCNCKMEKVKNYLIFPLINFELNLLLNFKDGGRVIVDIGNDYEIKDVELERESPQAEYFMENYTRDDIGELLL